MQYGFIDTQNRVIIPLQYDYLTDFRGQYAVVGKGQQQARQYGYLNRQGKFLVTPQYDDAGDFVEGFARSKKTANGAISAKTASLRYR